MAGAQGLLQCRQHLHDRCGKVLAEAGLADPGHARAAALETPIDPDARVVLVAVPDLNVDAVRFTSAPENLKPSWPSGWVAATFGSSWSVTHSSTPLPSVWLLSGAL